MTFLEFMAAALIAVYAMVGGAFINAAITAPSNMLKLLAAGWQSIIEFLLYGLIYVFFAIVFVVFTWPNGSLTKNPFLWLSAAHFALFAAFFGCRRIVEILLSEPDEKHDEDQTKAGQKEP